MPKVKDKIQSSSFVNLLMLNSVAFSIRGITVQSMKGQKPAGLAQVSTSLTAFTL